MSVIWSTVQNSWERERERVCVCVYVLQRENEMQWERFTKEINLAVACPLIFFSLTLKGEQQQMQAPFLTKWKIQWFANAVSELKSVSSLIMFPKIGPVCFTWEHWGLCYYFQYVCIPHWSVPPDVWQTQLHFSTVQLQTSGRLNSTFQLFNSGRLADSTPLFNCSTPDVWQTQLHFSTVQLRTSGRVRESMCHTVCWPTQHTQRARFWLQVHLSDLKGRYAT